MDRLKDLKITLPQDWIDASDQNPDGPPTFINESYEAPGILQISKADFIRGKVPNPSYEDLISLSENIGSKNEFGNITNRESGVCSFGKFGVVEFSGDRFPFSCIWHLSDGKDFIFATFICSEQPSVKEIDDARKIILTIRHNRFRFWK